MTEEHKTKCVTLPWCVIWIEDEYTEDTKTISTRTEKDDNDECDYHYRSGEKR